MKISLLFMVLLFATNTSWAQQTCQLELKNAPVFFGLRLGMTQMQVQAAFGREVKFKIKKTAERTFFQNFIKKPPPAFLSNVRALYLRFLNGELYQIEAFYNTRAEWQTLDEFGNWISKTKNVSSEFWVTQKGRLVAECDGFTLVADKWLNPRVELTDIALSSKVIERRQNQQ